jgi:hypothetical protein
MFHVPTHIFNAVMGTTFRAVTIWIKEDASVVVRLLDTPYWQDPDPPMAHEGPTSKQVYDMVKMIELELEPLKKLVYMHPDSP